MKQKKLTRGVASRIYRNAAEKLTQKRSSNCCHKFIYVHDYACHALGAAFVEEFFGSGSLYTTYNLPSLSSRQNWERVKGAFANSFKPAKRICEEAWFGNANKSVNRNARILALLTMAQNHSIRS